MVGLSSVLPESEPSAIWSHCFEGLASSSSEKSKTMLGSCSQTAYSKSDTGSSGKAALRRSSRSFLRSSCSSLSSISLFLFFSLFASFFISFEISRTLYAFIDEAYFRHSFRFILPPTYSNYSNSITYLLRRTSGLFKQIVELLELL